MRLLVCLLMLCLTTACTRESADSASYFPLAAGMQWRYRVTTEVEGRLDVSRLVQRNIGIEELDGVPHTVRVTDNGTRYYVRDSKDGIMRTAKRTIVELKPQPDRPPRWILRRPFAVGNTWSQETHPYVLRRLHPYDNRLARNIEFKMAYQIAALDDTVDVPAGRFENCIRVDGDAQLTIYADGRTGYQDIAVNTSEWYAPGIGLVKLVRSEPLSGEVFAGGQIVMELEGFGP